ncbi:MAG TPA: transcription antitermination factor NusB [Thermoanaerobaculia bacterium]|nr:transcription antitermination factor NusB [Thermoanaerobaculia bacterium]
MSERDRALDLLRRIEREQLYASIALAGDSGLVRTIVLGVLRWRSLLDFAIESLAERRLAKLDAVVVDILRIGIFQLRFMDVAKYAAVSETVELAGRHASRAKGFVNAILRRASERMPEPADEATRLAHPRWLFDRWAREFGEQRARAIAEANQQLSYPDALVMGGPAPAGSSPSMLVPGVVKLTGGTSELDRAAVYPMDEGSAVIAAIASAAGEEVLDLAAAPGGKTLYMTSRGTRVTSNDVSISRLRPLIGRARRVVVSDARRPPFSRRFETVLLDAPCSATGTIRKNPELKWRLREQDLESFATLQKELLAAALRLAEKTCLYSTCSLEREENDAVVEEALRGSGEFTVEDIALYAPAAARAWVEGGVLRLTPDSGADGFTAFALRRSK